MAARTKRQKSSESYKFLCGTCPDEECKARLYFPSYDKSVECTGCGQRHEKSILHDVAEVTNPEVAIHNLLKNILLGNRKPKKGADNVKVLGLSNYVCKLISPILTSYGMDRKTGKARLLKELGQDEVLNCGKILGNRAFVIEPENLDIIGYGRDRSGSLQYLADTLNDITAFNNDETRLIPIHADGDGHCLVHAISRALVGRELFWHALRVNLGQHIRENIDKYKALFQNFVDSSEWDDIINECDPYYIPPEGEPLGLRNIHIFGLANVLHRPIILLDSKSGMQSFGDYSGVFLPGFVKPEDCQSKDGSLNRPLCIAWSSSGRNHYIPLVGVKGHSTTYLPSYMVQKAWGMPKEEIKKYIEFDHMYRCIVGGDKCLTDKYTRQLVGAMEDIFLEQYHVHPSLVADVHQFIYKSSGIVGVQPEEVIERTQKCVQDQMLFRCLTCEALMEYHLAMDQFEKGGSAYTLAVNTHKVLDPTKLYSFPTLGAVCSYDKEKDILVPEKSRSHPASCVFCNGQMLRLVKADGSILYTNGDRTTTPSSGGKCICGFKHYWDGEEYDNLPEQLPVNLQWGGKVISETVAWFQHETDPTKNSNVFEVAQKLVQKYFPGEFGSERLVQGVVDTILAQTAIVNKDADKMEEGEQPSDTWSAEQASKIILTGHKEHYQKVKQFGSRSGPTLVQMTPLGQTAIVNKVANKMEEGEQPSDAWSPEQASKLILNHKTLHKEELTKSEKEKNVRKKIQTNAPLVQQKKTLEIQSHKTTAKSVPVKDQKSSQPKSQPSASSTSQSVSSSDQSTSSEKKVRLATSDGRQAMLSLVADVTFSELQKLIYQAVDVPVDRQRIRVGFPPKTLDPPMEGEEEMIIQLQHGDKVAVEVLPDQKQRVQAGPSHGTAEVVQSVPAPVLKQTSWSSFEENTTQNQSAETLLKALKNVQQTGDSIDTSIASLTIMSAVTGKDLWTYVQGMPHLFSVGGLFYNQVQRDLGLTDAKHCQLPCLPGKVFRYNAKEDRLELCLEPYGHFPIEPNIEQKVKDSHAEVDHDGAQVKFGASGVIRHGAEHKAFQGQGHSLKAAEDRMPVDLACATRRPQARGFRDLCVPGHHEDSITEETGDQMESESSEDMNPSSGLQRLGPGFSVIDPVSSNTTNSHVEMFRALAESIEKTLWEDQEGEEEETEPPTQPMGLFESIMATQSKQTVTMETTDSRNQSDQTVTQDHSGVNDIQTDKITDSEADKIETTGDMSKTVAMETETEPTETNQKEVISDFNSSVSKALIDNDDDKGSHQSDEIVIDKAVSEVTMEIVEETLSAVDGERKGIEDGVTQEEGGEILNRHNTCDSEEPAKTEISDVNDKQAEGDKNMEVETVEDLRKGPETVRTESVSEKVLLDSKSEDTDEVGNS